MPLNKGRALFLSLEMKQLLSFRMGYLGRRNGKAALAKPGEEHINEVCGIRSGGLTGWGPWLCRNPVNVWLVF